MKAASLARFCLCILLFAQSAHSQVGYVLSQEKEGTATFYLASDTATAYLIDGGKGGTLTAPHVNDMPVLKFFLENKYRNLVVVCSHPHEDHAGGIKDIINNDPLMEKFDSIHFVDSGYPQSDALYQLFVDRHPTYPLEKLTRASATQKNAFLEVSKPTDTVYVRNFEYTPQNRRAIHGNTIISIITLQQGGVKTTVVDFDDADDRLVSQWVEWAKRDPANRKPDVVIAPHHGSDRTDISAVLDESLRPKSVVITANVNNRYGHPGPVTLAKLAKALGVENVHITGFSGVIGISQNGLPAITDKSIFERIESAVETDLASTTDIRERQALRVVGQLYMAKRETARSKALAAGSFSAPANSRSTFDNPSTPSSAISLFKKGLHNYGWVVTVNSSLDPNKMFIHESDAGGYLHNLLYVAKREANGTWSVYKPGTGSSSYDEFIGEMEAPSDVKIGACTCE